MSLAYKLWKIGSVLTKDDIKTVLHKIPENKDGEEQVYLNINFKFKENNLISISLKKNSISKNKLFFSKKIGGTSNAYYLYPNITVLNDFPIKKIGLLENSLKYCTKSFCNDEFKLKIEAILNEIDEVKKQIKNMEKNKKIENLDENKKIYKIIKEISKFPKDNYWIWLSINDKTFYELMPEVFDNWYEKPVKARDPKNGYDIFTNKETKVGYKPEIKVFSYDQYHDILNYRIIEILPLSLESAKNIKFAWMYIIENLDFHYKGLEYIIIPNLLSDDDKIYKLILERLTKANKESKSKGKILEKLRKEEDMLKKVIKKIKSGDVKLEKAIEEILSKRNLIDIGIIQEFNEQLSTINEYLNSITMDYIFILIKKTDLSFEIKGSIEDVIPSQMSNVVKLMHEYKIDDSVKLGKRDREKTLLQDFFNRDELLFIVNRSTKNNSNKIFEERLYLAKLFLSDIKIKFNDLLKRFEFNRLYNYEQKNRVLKDGVREWIEFPNGFIEKEKNLVKFLTKLDKIQEE